jgi:hypothetical protein
MPTAFSFGRVRKIYKFIDAHRDQYDVTMMCRVLEVTRAGFYAWCKQPLSNRALEDTRLLRLIRASFTASHGIYGAPVTTKPYLRDLFDHTMVSVVTRWPGYHHP